jgi:hypothetical protein
LSQDRNDEEEKVIHYESGVPIFGPPPKDQDAEQRAEREAARTYEDRQISLQKQILWTQIGLVVFGLIGAGIGLWQANISQQSADTSDKSVLLAQKSERSSAKASSLALKQARDNFVLDQRPVIWMSPPRDGARELDGIEFAQSPLTRGTTRGQVVWQWHFMNYGRSPANKIILHSFIKVGENPEESTFGAKKHDPMGTPLPPGKIDYAATASQVLERAEYDSAVHAEKISIRGIITYWDISGNQYETDFCLRQLESGATTYCEKGNYIK